MTCTSRILPLRLPTCLILLLALLGGTAGAGDEADVDARKRANAAARRLGRQVFPAPEKLGAGWRAPWQLPASWKSFLEIEGTSADTYWKSYQGQDTFPAGLDRKTGASLLLAKARSLQEGATTIPPALLFGWHESEATTLRPPAESMQSAAREEQLRLGIYKATKARHQNSSEWFEAKRTADRKWQEERVRELGGMAALQDRLLDLLTLRRAAVQLTYYHTEDWKSAESENAFEAIFGAKGTVSAVLVDVTLIDESKVGAVQDYAEAQLRAIGGEVQKAMQDRYEFLRTKRPMMLDKDHAPPRVTFQTRPYGTGCHLVTVTGSTSLSLGLEGATRYVAWLRNGPALVQISLRARGNAQAAEARITKLLELMDAATQVFALDDE